MVLIYGINGKVSRPIITSGIGEPHFVAMNARHDIYVANYALPPPNSPDVAIYSPRGKPKTSIATD